MLRSLKFTALRSREERKLNSALQGLLNEAKLIIQCQSNTHSKL